MHSYLPSDRQDNKTKQVRIFFCLLMYMMQCSIQVYLPCMCFILEQCG